MSYEAKVFNVMIASPGDVAEEREVIRKVIYEWDAIHSQSRGIVLLPVGWESHSSPEMGSRPQEIINHQILEKSDLLIGVFWTRLGTETGEFASGTVEEIEKHIKQNKPAMLYFSSKPASLETVDLEQVMLLKEFKTSCQSRGLYETYDNCFDFKEKFNRHLQLKLNDSLFIGYQQILDELEDDNKASLSNEASILLKEASLDKNGIVMLAKFLSETILQTNEKNLILSNDRREIAKWEAALEELVYNDLLVERGNEGEVFEMTDKGYKIADMIK